MNVLAYVLPAAVALLIGVVAGSWWGRRARQAAARPDPAEGPTLAELLRRTFRSSGTGLAVLSRHGDVVMFNDQAVALGVVAEGRVEARAWVVCERVLVDGTVQVVDLSPLERGGRRPEAVLATVRPIGDGFLLVEAADTSDAVRLEATRRDFVANVSHELKTPVGAVALLAEAVLDAVDDPVEVHRFATKILNESTRLGNLVTELIALSRLTGAERLPELAAVEVDDVVREAMARSRLSAESSSIEIAVDADSGIEVGGDRTLLVTALSNLVENAIAYSPAGASVSVSRRRNGEFVEIAVTDRGIGIAPEHQQRVFERFFRVDPARSRATGGTGLGLAIVKHVLANHGGEVTLWSSPGTGSTFTMRLPAATRGANPDAASTDLPDPATLAGRAGG
ncbi:two-component sensor histidine kinase [Pseudonocardia sulfidoxydans NBRC 16205]|uniref:Sensor-like histidine kinase SenX3 n=1 Tax=Pseudonocardia sulfidoxydans NBRC 16205 TaxID=1223511 RepID=A0A511DCQ6_9PSEU|nr:ATP-binding protein [Pseudonocardia sulfidoxydans]GEL22173.1 two-component sensor histidine kinase [Pseudonocardia sulfidoxydans NBRC 16205]